MGLDEALAWDPVVEALARQTPHWAPGTRHGYHATTFGWLVGEVVRRVSGKSLGDFFRQEVADPLGLSFWIGLPEAEEPRVVPVIPFKLPANQDTAGAMSAFLGPGSNLMRALGAPGGALSDIHVWNRRDVRAAQIPAANGVTDARSLARMYAAMVGEVEGTRLLGAEQLRKATRQETSGPDEVLLNLDLQWGLGYILRRGIVVLGGPGSFGHFGAGGSAGWADPDAGLAFGYVMNRMDIGLTGDLRSTNLIQSVYRASEATHA